MRVSFVLLAIVILSLAGCHEVPEDAITKALSARSASFRPNLAAPIPLNEQRTARIKQIVAKFRDKSKVSMETDILGLQHGHFLLDGQVFAWQGSILYLPEGQRRNWVVADPVLEMMGNAYMKAREESPYQLSPEAWERILSQLDHKH